MNEFWRELNQLPSQNAFKRFYLASFIVWRIETELPSSFPPCSDQQTLLVRTRLEPILNCSLKDIKWLQSVLSIEAGLFAAGFIGLVGLSRIESLTISSCSSSHL